MSPAALLGLPSFTGKCGTPLEGSKEQRGRLTSSWRIAFRMLRATTNRPRVAPADAPYPLETGNIAKLPSVEYGQLATAPRSSRLSKTVPIACHRRAGEPEKRPGRDGEWRWCARPLGCLVRSTRYSLAKPGSPRRRSGTAFPSPSTAQTPTLSATRLVRAPLPGNSAKETA